MPEKTRFDIESENFDFYFANQINHIPYEAKEHLPSDISFKLYRSGSNFLASTTGKLKFIDKLYILWRAMKKRWWIEHRRIC